MKLRVGKGCMTNEQKKRETPAFSTAPQSPIYPDIFRSSALLLRLQYKRPDEPSHFPALASFPYRHNPPQTAENLKEKTPPKICSTLKPGTLNPSPFSRKTDRTESQKPPSRKFSYPFVYNDLSRFHARLRPPNFNQKRRSL